MVGQITKWKCINNNVGDRMIDGSLTHMFTARRRIRRRTQILNRELRQLHSINSYRKFVKVKKTVLRIAPEDSDTDEDYFSNNDLDDTHKLAKSTDSCKNDDDKICDEYDINEMELCDIGIDDKTSGQCSNDVSESESETDEEIENVQRSVIEVKRSSIKKDIKRNLDDDFDKLSDVNTEIAAPGDSGIDEDSVDSVHMKPNRIDCVQKEKEIIEEDDDQTLTTMKKTHPKITCTEIVTSKYRILRDDKKSVKSDTNEQSLRSSIVEQTDSPEKNTHSDAEACNKGKSEIKTTTLTIPSEIDSLKYILTNLSIHNRYENDFYVHNYNNETANEYQPDACETDDIGLATPMNLDDLMEIENLIELDVGSTLTFKDITEDDEIFLMEIPKSLIDNQDLRGKRMKIKKRSVLIDTTKYETYRKPIEDLTCILKKEDSDASYKIGTIKPKASIVLRQPPLEKNSAPLASNLIDDGNQHAPFPKSLKRRNPLVLQPDSNNEYSKRKRNEILDQIQSLKRDVDESI